MIPMLLRNKPFYDFYDDLFDLEKTHSVNSDIKETEDGFSISVDLPGVERDQIKLKWERNSLTVEAVRNQTRDSPKYTTHTAYGKFNKTYRFSTDISKNVEATLKNGVLDIFVKKEKAEEHLIMIN